MIIFDWHSSSLNRIQPISEKSRNGNTLYQPLCFVSFFFFLFFVFLLSFSFSFSINLKFPHKFTLMSFLFVQREGIRSTKPTVINREKQKWLKTKQSKMRSRAPMCVCPDNVTTTWKEREYPCPARHLNASIFQRKDDTFVDNDNLT